jgi:hypothetical protein
MRPKDKGKGCFTEMPFLMRQRRVLFLFYTDPDLVGRRGEIRDIRVGVTATGAAGSA